MVDATGLGERIGDAADVYSIPTGDVTWRLTALLPEKLDVYGGAVRVWWPGVSGDSNPYDHPLLFVWDDADARRAEERIADMLGVPRAPGETARLEPGTIVEVTVGDLVDYGAFVTVESGRRGLVHISELAVQHPAEVVDPGDVYNAAVLWDDDRGLAVSFRRRPDGQDGTVELEALRNEVRALAEDRRAVLEELAKAKERVQLLERRLREARAAAPRTTERPLDAEAFLELLWASYDTRYTPDDKQRYPLRRVTLGPVFIERVRRLEGVSVEKTAEVSADVAARRAHEISGREVHELHTGVGGSPQRIRSRDGATAWRCALQLGTPSARRLHWWELRDGSIELASVGKHDDFSIPE